MSTTPPIESAQAKNLAHECQSHLNRELEVIRRFVALSEEIQNSLGRSVFPTIESIQQEQRALVEIAKTIAVNRDNLRHQISTFLNVPFQDATIRKLIDSLPASLAASLTNARQEIIQLHARVSQLNQANSLLLQQSIDIYQKLFYGLSGQTPQTQTYSADGQVSNNASISLVSTDC